MAKYRITGPDGAVYEVTAPDDATEDQVMSYFQSQMRQPEAVETVGKAANSAIGQIPRQLGLTARAGLNAAGNAIGILSDPIASTLNLGAMAFGADPIFPNARQTFGATADAAGLPKPETPTERVAQQATEFLGGVGMMGGAGKLAQAGPGLVAQAGEFIGGNLGGQAGAAIGAGLLGGASREAGGGPLTEGVAGLIGGVAGGGAVAAGGAVANAAKRRMMTLPQIDVRIESILGQQGVDWKALPAATKTAIRKDVQAALRVGDSLDDAALRRLADYRAVGATPTRGRITLDPVTVTREKNLSKMTASASTDGLQGLPAVDAGNNRLLTARLGEMVGQNADDMSAGGLAIGAVQARDDRIRNLQSRLYERARESAGRDIPLDREQFVLNAYRKLSEANKGAFLPDDVNRLLEQIRTGKASFGGQQFDTPFTVDTIDNLKTALASASRGAKDGNVRSAIGMVREALEELPIRAQTSTGGIATPGMAQAIDELPAQALRNFDRARKLSRARFGWAESAPGIKAALDDASPDNFVRKFIISDSASFNDAAKLAREVRRNPQAMQAARSNIAAWLKEKATSGAADDVANFSAPGFNRALKQVERKLGLFFSPEEIEQLRAIGRVASYETVQPRGSAVNNSNSGALLLGKGLDMVVGGSKFLPFGRAVVSEPAQSARISIGTGRALNVAPSVAVRPQAERTPALLAPLVLTPGLLAAE